jgi:hypothetical protein
VSAIAARAPAPRADGGRQPTLRLGAALVAGGLGFGLLAGYLGTTGHVTRVTALAIVLVPVVLWKRPYLAPAMLLSAAILIEQAGQVPSIPFTSRVPLFQAVGPGHLQGADILLLIVLLICFMKRHELKARWWPRSHLSAAILAMLACVVAAVAIGRAHGGDLRTSLMECRPYIYLAVSYLLTAALAADRRAIQAALWGFTGSVGFKAVQGIYVWVRHRHMYPKPEAYIGHEASYFFVIFVILVLTLWMFHQRGRLRATATCLLPLVMWADVVNDRRVAWAMLAGALVCFAVIVYQALPRRRPLLGKSVVALLLIGAVYFPVMWNSNSSLAQPARAIKSQITPTARDASSDLYRVQENANLQLNIRQGGLLGKGFGVKVDYALPIADISSIDPLIAYIPHNDVLDVMMRLGLAGSVVIWFVIGAGIIAGIRLARARVGTAAIVGAVTAPALVAYAVMGAEDQGFFLFRLAFITGVLLGLTEAARRLPGVAGARVAAR